MRSLPGTFFLLFLVLKCFCRGSLNLLNFRTLGIDPSLPALEPAWTSPLQLHWGFLSHLYVGSSCANMPGRPPGCLGRRLSQVEVVESSPCQQLGAGQQRASPFAPHEAPATRLSRLGATPQR